jgi:hypothetical protein
MICDRFRSQLADVALGAPATPPLLSHLEACPRCSAWLDRERALLARIDDEVRATLALTPSADLPALARRRAAETARASGSGRWWWLVPAAAAAGALALTVYLVSDPPGPRPDPPQRAAIAPSRATSAAAVDSPRSQPPPGTMERPAREHRFRAHASVQGTLAATVDYPLVIVPPGQEAAVRRAIAAMRGMTVTPDPVRGDDGDEFDLPEPRVAPSSWAHAMVRLYPSEMDGEAAVHPPPARPVTMDSDEWRNES